MTDTKWVDIDDLGCTKTKAADFVAELVALCIKHKVTLSTSSYDGLQVWDRTDDSIVYVNGIEDCTKP